MLPQKSISERLKLWARRQVGLAPLAQERLGAIQDKPDPRDHVRAKIAFAPPSFSLAEFGIPEALDQKRTSSCTGHAGAAFVANLFGRVIGRKAMWQPSPFWLYYQTRKQSGLEGSDDGAHLRDLMKVLAEDGAASRSLHASMDPQVAPTAHSISVARAVRIRSYQRILPEASAPEVMMTALSLERLPIIIGIRLFADVNSADTRWDGVIDIPKPGELLIGGHAMLIDGYDGQHQWFTGLNSWGKDWGDGGRFYIPFEYFTRPDLVSDIWTADYRAW